MKWTLAAFAALAVAAFLSPALQSGSSAAAAATPTPAALQYDEITRTVIPPATPPAPGTFAADYQTAAAATPMPKLPGFNMGTLFNVGALKAYGQQLQQMVNGLHLTRYTFYKGWIRRDDPIARTATIEKCDQRQYIKLDLANKTYTMITAAGSTPMQPMGGVPQPSREAPGTVDLTATATSNNLGPMTIDGIATTGWNRSVEMKMTNATGSCRNADFNMNVTQYVSSINVPHRFCPLPHGMNPMEAAGAMQGGCKPTVEGAQGSDFNLDTMGSSGGSADDLVMFSRMSAGGGTQGPAGFGMIVERGNVTWFGGADAAALFEIPAGFTQAPGS
jgi:hypothetical protein